MKEFDNNLGPGLIPYESLRNRVKRMLKSQPILILFVIIFLSLVITIFNPTFLSLRNILAILQQSSVTGIATMCMLILMISGGLDFSIGSIISLVCVTIAKLVALGYSMTIAVTVGMLISVSCGFLNGIIVAKSKCAPIIITLGLLYVYYGIALNIAQGTFLGIGGKFKFLGMGKIGIIPVPFLIWVIISLVVLFIIGFTKFGRRLVSIGGNEQASYLAGINVDYHKILAYTINGVIAGLAALVLISRLGSVLATVGAEYALKALSAAVIGGVSFEGGRGSVGGAFLGVILLGIVYNAMNILGISSYFQSMVLGVIVVAAVVTGNIGKIRRV